MHGGDIFGSVEFQMSLLLFVALSGYVLASFISQPAVVGEILVGIVIGPSVLAWITYTDFVSSLAKLGAVILLFVVGLEFKLKDIGKIRYMWIALFGVIVPWLGGYLVARYFGFASEKALLIGVTLTATSIAITADTLREMGKLQTEVAKTIIGAAVIDDILALTALAFTQHFANGTIEWSVTGFLLIKAAAFIVISAMGGIWIAQNWIQKLDDSAFARKYPEFIFVVAMLLAFAYAMIAEVIGLSAIVGAFIAGVSLEGVNLKHSKQFKEGADYLRILFGAIFFVSLGVLADISTFNLDILYFLLALSVVAILSKLIGCGIPAKLTGMSSRDSLIVGLGMSPRGEVAMIVALLALQQHIIEQPSFVAIILMSLITTLIVPVLLRQLMKHQ
ncbi:MAG: cation:proton antiporter [Gammaproteobacteria bacterium]